MTILHIVNWFPSKKNPKEALWIKRHIESLEPYSKQTVFHLNISPGKMEFCLNRSSLIIRFPRMPWMVAELLSGVALAVILVIKKANEQYDIINFHIGYPNLTYWHIIKHFIKLPLGITEHWSAYHNNFGLKEAPWRIQRIYRQKISVICVSKALVEDISRFSGARFPFYVIPNIVSGNLQNNEKRIPNRFFMLSQWKKPKRPNLVIDAFKRLVVDYPTAELVIGGYGPLYDEMRSNAYNCGSIKFVGLLDQKSIAEQFGQCEYFIHPSDYETFSVVCAEAVTAGCFVIASQVGGIPEFINERNGLLVYPNTRENFEQAMRYAIENPVSVSEIPDFSKERVGQSYFESLGKILNEAY